MTSFRTNCVSCRGDNSACTILDSLSMYVCPESLAIPIMMGATGLAFPCFSAGLTLEQTAQRVMQWVESGSCRDCSCNTCCASARTMVFILEDFDEKMEEEHLAHLNKNKSISANIPAAEQAGTGEGSNPTAPMQANEWEPSHTLEEYAILWMREDEED